MVLLDGELQIPHFVLDDNPFQVASGVICRGPQGLKPASLLALCGTLRLRSGQALEAVPFLFVEEGGSFRSAEALRHSKSSARPELVRGLRRGKPRLYSSFWVGKRRSCPDLSENALILRCECRTCRGPSTT